MRTLSRPSSVCLILAVSAIVIVATYGAVRARSLTYVSDLIGSSVPSATSTHSIQFTAYSGIPVSGHIIVTPMNGAYTLESGFDYTDVDLAVSSGGPFVDRALAASASATEDGVSISGGVITITLNSSNAIAAGSIVRITLGMDAIYGVTGDKSPVNPASAGSYRIALSTTDQANVSIDNASAMIAISTPISVGVVATNQPPVRVNGLPSGDIAAGNTNIQLSLGTNKPSTCRYATTTGIAYSSMTSEFSSSGGTIFYTAISGHTDNTSYSYYVRCSDTSGTVNPDDYPISFTILPTAISSTSIAQSGSGGSGGVGSFPNGSSVLYLAQTTLSGWTSPDSTVSVLKDGVALTTTRSNGNGSFEIAVGGVERGTYTFSTFATDSAGRKSSSFNATLTLESGTQNKVVDIVLSPTLELVERSIGVGDSAQIVGRSVPGSHVEVYVTRAGGIGAPSDTLTLVATSTGSGAWEVQVPGDKLQKGTYGVQARAAVQNKSQSVMSQLLTLEVGNVTSKELATPDINKDGKVNLVDFSIFLLFWATDEWKTDFNGDATANLADFSIMLFSWTG